MISNGPAKRTKLGVLALSTMMLVTLLVPLSSGEAEAAGPCPWYSVQNVLDDPSGNWDGDQVKNADEFYNGLNPCKVDTGNFCAGGGNALCIYPVYTYTYIYVASPCQVSTAGSPHADYDGDGFTNAVELRNGANPCVRPCPRPTTADLALDPNGDWDRDGVSNAVEVNRRTNPCRVNAYVICPHYSTYDVNANPYGDWDYDGIANATETRRGTNPCVYNATTVYTPPPTRTLPHVSAPTTTYVAPPPPVVRTCPPGYPYYHSGSGNCYANPVGNPFR